MNSKTASKFRSAESPTRLVIAVGIATMFASSSALAADPKLEISGQINAAMLFGGDIADPEIVDNNASGTRLRVRGSRDAFGTQRAFLRYEFQAQENSSSGAVDGSESFDTRFAEVGLRGGWGSLSLGKGEGATDGTAEISYQVSGNLFGGGHLPLITVADTLNRDNVSNVGYNYYDGFGRVSRLRYDSPKMWGFTAAASVDSGDRNELALRYRDNVGPGKLLGNLGVADSSDGNNDRNMLGVGYRHNSGLSFSYSYSDRTQFAAPDLESQLLSFNYEINKWTFSVDVGDQGVDGENEVMNVGFVYKDSKPLHFYAAYTTFDNADGSDLDAFFVGARYTFAADIL